ncbi:MAG: metallopeptidase TldD-related protein, partial [Gemmatimonadaceae bacterium]
KAIEPGTYTVVLEPRAVADLIPNLISSFDARVNDEGRGTFSKAGGGTSLGEKIADERVTIFSDPSDPSDPELQAQPFDNAGLPLCRLVYIEKGILKSFTYDRYWAQKQGVAATRAAAAAGIHFAGGTRSAAAM